MPEIEFTHQDPAVVDEGVHGKVKLLACWSTDAPEALDSRGVEIETTQFLKCEGCVWSKEGQCTGMKSISPRVAGLSDCHTCESAVVYAEATFSPSEEKTDFLSGLKVEGGQHVHSSRRMYSFPPELPCAQPTAVTVQTKEHLLD